MTREQFEQLMEANNWPAELRRSWDKFTPLGDVDTFNREWARPDGIIEVQSNSAAHIHVRVPSIS